VIRRTKPKRLTQAERDELVVAAAAPWLVTTVFDQGMYFDAATPRNGDHADAIGALVRMANRIARGNR
jgi:hypothetical protein